MAGGGPCGWRGLGLYISFVSENLMNVSIMHFYTFVFVSIVVLRLGLVPTALFSLHVVRVNRDASGFRFCKLEFGCCLRTVAELASCKLVHYQVF